MDVDRIKTQWQLHQRKQVKSQSKAQQIVNVHSCEEGGWDVQQPIRSDNPVHDISGFPQRIVDAIEMQWSDTNLLPRDAVRNTNLKTNVN